MNSFSNLFRGGKSHKHSGQPKLRLFESLETREMMTVSPLFYASAPVQPAVAQQVTVATNLPVNGTLKVASMPSVPAFSSLSGASATLYLDFDGHFQDVPAVGNSPNLLSPAFDIDGKPQDFFAERQIIHEIWARAAEDYSPFNINVTTVDPGDFSHGSMNLRVVITGEDFSAEDAGGRGHVNAFSSEKDPNVVYVFSISKGFAEDDPQGLRALKSIGNLVSHEAGHAFGLEHYTALGDDKKAPIMGNANGSERGIWWKGTNVYGDMQYDMETIASVQNGFGYRPDGPDSFAGAGQLQVGGRGFEGRGVIHHMSDVDVYRFDTLGGQLEIFAEPARAVIGAQPVSFGNLDAVVELFDSNGKSLGRGADDSRTDAALSIANAAAGTYFVKVSSQGAYGDVGQYRLSVEEFDPPRVISSNVVDLGTNLTGVWIKFSQAINASTFTTADVKATGVSVLGVSKDVNDPTRFLVKVTSPGAALWSLTIGPDIRDLGGQMMDQNRDGIQGGTADVYRLFFPGNNLLSLEQVKPTTSTTTKMTTLMPVLVDAVFAS